MSTVDRTRPVVLPPLIDGQRLDRATFHERYEAMPPATRAELISGVVHTPSPLRSDHGNTTFDAVAWLGQYRRRTPGVIGSENASTFLDDSAEPQPDVSLRIDPAYGGQTRLQDGYIAAAPELVIEIARSSRANDLGPKKDDYERAGVLEYLVVALEPNEIFWFTRQKGRFVRRVPDSDGVYRSLGFPGLWLDPPALFGVDLERLFGVLDQGLSHPDHAAFVARLTAAPRNAD